MSAVILDRDGVLTSFDVESALAYINQVVPLSLDALLERWHLWGEEHGNPSTYAAEARFFKELWLSIAHDYDLESDATTRLLNFDYTNHMLVYDDVIPALEFISERGIKIGVLSNFALATLDRSLRKLGLSRFIDVACAASVIGVAKPDRNAYYAICHRLNEDPNSCLFFDDEPECVVGAYHAGLRAWLVNRGEIPIAAKLPQIRSLGEICHLLEDM